MKKIKYILMSIILLCVPVLLSTLFLNNNTNIVLNAEEPTENVSVYYIKEDNTIKAEIYLYINGIAEIKVTETGETFSYQYILEGDKLTLIDSNTTGTIIELKVDGIYIIGFYEDFIVQPEPEEFDFGIWLEETFTPELIASIITALTTLGVVLKMALTLKQLAQSKQTNAEEIKNKILSTLKEQVDETTYKSIEKIVNPIINSIQEIKPYLDIFAKILMLSQINDDKSRLEILNLIESLGSIDKKSIDNAKETINEQISAEEKKKEETIEKLNKISEKKQKPTE